MKKSAFTLIELLVVITIIAILAGIALPVFSGVQERSRAVQDANNLRQLGLASTAYFNDHDDTIFATGSSFSRCLNPKYVTDWKVFQSPFETDATRLASVTTATPVVSYDLNRNLMGNSTSNVASSSSCIMLAPLIQSYNPIKFLPTSTSTPALAISSNGSGATGGTHSKGKRMNVLFQDAHVESMMMIDFHSPLTNPDSSSSITDIRWNQ